MNVEFLFWSSSLLILGAAFFVLVTRNVLYAAISLMVALLGIAVIFIIAQADFLAVTQIMIYVGGVITLLVFGVMLSKSIDIDKSRKFDPRKLFLSSFTAVLTGGGLLFTFSRVQWDHRNSTEVLDVKTTTFDLGVELLTTYLIPFELVAILLLVALVGAVFVASKVLIK